MHDHLVAIACRPSVQIGRQRTLGDQAQRVGSPLAGGRLDAVALFRLPPLLVEAVGRRLECAPHHGAHLGRQPATNHHHPVVIDPGLEMSALVPARVIGCFGVEFPDEDEQLVGGRLNPGRQLGDGVAQAIDLGAGAPRRADRASRAVRNAPDREGL